MLQSNNQLHKLETSDILKILQKHNINNEDLATALSELLYEFTHNGNAIHNIKNNLSYEK